MDIHNVIQKLGIWQEGRANFLDETSDHCRRQGARSRRKIGCEADAAKNQFLNHVVYKQSPVEFHMCIPYSFQCDLAIFGIKVYFKKALLVNNF